MYGCSFICNRKCELSLYIDEDTGMMETGISVEKEMSKKLSEMSLEELWKLILIRKQSMAGNFLAWSRGTTNRI